MDRFVKIVTIVGFLLIAAALLVLIQNPSQGYELSIYEATPAVFWWLLVAAIVTGITIVVYEVIRGNHEKSNLWKVGLGIVVLANLVIVLLPALKGFVFAGNQDHLSHLGIIKDILATSSMGTNNIYPVTHILLAQFSMLSSIQPEQIIAVFGAFNYLLSVVFTYLWCKEILPTRVAVLAALAAGVLLVYYHTRVIPFGFASTLLPLALYLYFKLAKRQTASIRFILILLAIMLVFTHPITAFVFVFIIGAFEIIKLRLSKKALKEKMIHSSNQIISLGLPILTFSMLFVWLWQNRSFWRGSINGMFQWFQGELLGRDVASVSLVGTGFEGIAKLGLDAFETLKLLFIGWGDILIIFLLAFIATLYIVRKKTDLQHENKNSLIMITWVFWAVAILGIISYFRAITILDSGRILYYIFPLLPPLIGLALFYIFRRYALPKVTFTISAVAIISVISIFNLYQSPLMYQRGIQVSHGELSGITWFIETTDSEIEYVSIEIFVTRHYTSALFGQTSSIGLSYPTRSEEWIGDHFYYDQRPRYGESFSEDRYLVQTEYDRLLYTELWPQIGRFSYDDFAKLEQDPSVDKLYANGEVDIFYVNALGGAQ